MNSVALRDSVKLPIKSKNRIKKNNLNVTISKISENYLEWTWDTEREGHYRPIMSKCYEIIKYRVSLEDINALFKEMSVYPYVITKLKIIESNNKLKGKEVKR
ncbi:hypothetical protein ES705_44736 [subsurface metagenome]